MNTSKNLLILLLIAASYTSCNKSPEKLIVGKWKLTEISGPNLNDEAAKKDLYSRVTFNFLADGKYEIVGLKDGGDQGKWTISKDGKSLTTKSVDGQGDVSTITEITADKLLMTQAEAKMVFAKVK